MVRGREGEAPYDWFAPGVQPEKERLLLLARAYDGLSTSRLARVPLRAGDHCLEVGAGVGTMSLYLASRVGPSGLVLATDRVPEVITCAGGPIEVAGLDVVQAPVPAGPWTLVYARAVLNLLADRRRILRSLAHAVSPGGSVVVETFDMSWVAAKDRGPLGDVWNAMIEGGRLVGTDQAWFAGLVEDMVSGGLEVVSAEASVTAASGGSVVAQYWHASLLLAKPLLVDLVGAETVDAALLELADTDALLHLPSLTWCWGTRA